MNTFRVTFSDGTGYTTEANGTREEFESYLRQGGGVFVDEDPVTGKETRRWLQSVEQVLYKIQVRVIETSRACSECGDHHTHWAWRDVHPTHGPAYTYPTRTEAESIRDMCYGAIDSSESRVIATK